MAGELVELLSVVVAGALLLGIAALLAAAISPRRSPVTGPEGTRDPGFEGGEPPLDGGLVRSSALDLGRGLLLAMALGLTALLAAVAPACLELARDASFGLLRALLPALVAGVAFAVILLHARGSGDIHGERH